MINMGFFQNKATYEHGHNSVRWKFEKKYRLITENNVLFCENDVLFCEKKNA